MFFIDKEKDLAEELEAEVERREEGGRATVVQGDVNLVLSQVMKQINPRSPTFVFLDTEGIEPSWETIELLSEWQTELLVNFPLGMAINRNPDSAKTEAYFGTPEWRPLWEAGRLSKGHQG